jgi:hypothetical protein
MRVCHTEERERERDTEDTVFVVGFVFVFCEEDGKEQEL